MPTSNRTETTPLNVFRCPASQLVVSPLEKGIRPPDHEFGDEPPLEHNTKPSTSLKGEIQVVRHVDRGAPGDTALAAMVQRGPEDTDRARQRTKFYGEVFAYREANSSAKERAARESVVMGELKTNVIVRNYGSGSREYVLIIHAYSPRSRTNMLL